ncbi:MAG: PadR family transcriptional regulator, partial [Clostridiales bacterium]|nr:PadR family transcriptional regulator [Clostridiales bacterium]
MDISTVNSDILRGNVTTIILSSISEGEGYCYDILREIEAKSDGQYRLKQATLYSCLKRLEKQGLVYSYLGEQDDTGGGRRRYYKLTDEGRQYLEQTTNEYVFSRTILDKLVSGDEFDFTNPAPFDPDGLRPYTKRRGGADDDPSEFSVVETEKILEREIVREVTVEREITKEVPFEVESVVEIPVEIIREVPVVTERTVEVEVVREVPVEVIREFRVTVETEKPVESVREIIKEIPVETIKEVEVVKEVQVPVDRPVEIIREVEVVREVQVSADCPTVREIEVVKEVQVPVDRPVEIIREV